MSVAHRITIKISRQAAKIAKDFIFFALRLRVSALFTKQGTAFATAYTYDPLDRVKTMLYPDGDLLTYGYNDQGLPENMTSSAAGTLVGSADYDALGRVQERVLGAGTYRTKYSYYDWNLPNNPNAGRLEKIETGTGGDPDSLQGLIYNYDAVGNVASVQDMTNNGQRQCYVYDHLDRLTRAFTGKVGCTTYNGTTGVGVYDRSYGFVGAEGKLGNLTSLGGLSYGYNDSNHPHAVTHVDGALTYSYDAAGNMTIRGDMSLDYDSQNRLRSLWDNGQFKASYEYDDNGARRSRRPHDTSTRRPATVHAVMWATIMNSTRTATSRNTTISAAP